MPTSPAWYLVHSTTKHNSPVALIADREQAERFLHEHYYGGHLEKVDVSHCIVRPIVEMVNEHSPIALGGTHERL
jgi:hypothetical protein